MATRRRTSTGDSVSTDYDPSPIEALDQDFTNPPEAAADDEAQDEPTAVAAQEEAEQPGPEQTGGFSLAQGPDGTWNVMRTVDGKEVLWFSSGRDPRRALQDLHAIRDQHVGA